MRVKLPKQEVREVEVVVPVAGKTYRLVHPRKGTFFVRVGHLNHGCAFAKVVHAGEGTVNVRPAGEEISVDIRNGQWFEQL